MDATDRRIIEASLRNRGLWNADGVSRKARARLCKKCQAPVMVGLDDERCGIPVTVDPTPLNALGEVQALMTGRATFSLRYVAGRYEIDHRDSFRISGTPAGSDPRLEVLAEHECNSPPVDSSMRGNYLPAKNAKTIDDDNPPF
jgi:hypothetical protein